MTDAPATPPFRPRGAPTSDEERDGSALDAIRRGEREAAEATDRARREAAAQRGRAEERAEAIVGSAAEAGRTAGRAEAAAIVAEGEGRAEAARAAGDAAVAQLREQVAARRDALVRAMVATVLPDPRDARKASWPDDHRDDDANGGAGGEGREG